jgi:hypothetical protein
MRVITILRLGCLFSFAWVDGFMRSHHIRSLLKHSSSQSFNHDVELSVSTAEPALKKLQPVEYARTSDASTIDSGPRPSTSREFLRKMKAFLIRCRPDTRYRKILDEITSFHHKVAPREFTITITKLINLISSSRKLSNLNQLLVDVESFHEFDFMFYSTAINSLQL